MWHLLNSSGVHRGCQLLQPRIGGLSGSMFCRTSLMVVLSTSSVFSLPSRCMGAVFSLRLTCLFNRPFSANVVLLCL